MGPVLTTEHTWAQSCPGARRDYVKAAAWLCALLFGPALVALAVLLLT
jgi:hypothetical protein